MELTELIQQLNTTDDELALALEALNLDVKDVYSPDEVSRISSRISCGKALEPAASEGSEVNGEPDSRVFGPPHPGLDEDVPVHVMSLVPYGSKLTPAGLVQYRFDQEAVNSEIVRLTRFANDHTEAFGNSLRSYAMSAMAKAKADIDMRIAVKHAEAIQSIN